MFGDLSALVQQHGLFGLRTSALLPFVNRCPHQQGLAVALELRGGQQQRSEPTKTLFDDILGNGSSLSAFNNNENRDQVRAIKQHYLNEFGKYVSLEEVMEDCYSDNVVIHEVVDNIPHTYRGREGVRRAFRAMYGKFSKDKSRFEIEHIAVNHAHAQVVWKAVIPGQDVVVRGMDSFQFDEENRIMNQSIMAISSEIGQESTLQDSTR